MTDFNLPGTGMGGADPIVRKILDRASADDQFYKDSQAKREGIYGEVDKLRAAKEAEVGPARDKLLAANAKGGPTPPAQTPMPTAPKAPEIDTKEMHETLSLVTALAALGGALTRQPLTAALNSFSAGVKGYVQGKQQVFDQEIKSFHAKLEEAKSAQDAMFKEYQAAREKNKDDIQAMQNEYSLIAAKHDSGIDMQLAQLGRLSDIDKSHDAQSKNFGTVMTNVGRMVESKRAHDESHRHNLATEQQKAKASTDALAAGNFDESDVAYWAEVMQKGGSLPPRLTTTPGGKKLVADIMKHVAKSGVSPSEMLTSQAELMGLKAAERTAGTRGANIEMAVNEAHNMQNIVLETSEKFGRTNFMPINKALKSFEDNTGSTESRQFGAALNSFINAYARAISPSGVPTVSDKDHAREMLSTADSHEQVKAILGTLNQEMEAARKSPGQVRSALREGATGKPPAGGVVNWSDLK